MEKATSPLTHIPHSLRYYRMSRGEMQHEVAAALGIIRAQYAQIESGQRRLRADECYLLCLRWGISIDELLTPLPEAFHPRNFSKRLNRKFKKAQAHWNPSTTAPPDNDTPNKEQEQHVGTTDSASSSRSRGSRKRGRRGDRGRDQAPE